MILGELVHVRTRHWYHLLLGMLSFLLLQLGCFVDTDLSSQICPYIISNFKSCVYVDSGYPVVSSHTQLHIQVRPGSRAGRGADDDVPRTSRSEPGPRSTLIICWVFTFSYVPCFLHYGNLQKPFQMFHLRVSTQR